jgi:hypothetical protein
VSRINWIKGELIGRLGDIVGSRHEGKAYIKTFTPPANPKTDRQIEIRTIARKLGKITRQIHVPLMEYIPNMKGQKLLQYLITLNKDEFKGEFGQKWSPEKLSLAEGLLPTETLDTARINVYEGETSYYCNINWETAQSRQSDVAIGVVYDDKLDRVSYNTATRGDSSVEVNVTDWFNQSDRTSIYAYVFFAETATVLGRVVGVANSNTVCKKVIVEVEVKKG